MTTTETPRKRRTRKSNGNGNEQPLAEHDRAAQPVDGEEPPRLEFPVVGIGASAGGLEAAMEFFKVMRADSGMAFVLVQHLPPDRESLIAEILSKKTQMPVHQVDQDVRLEVNNVYVIRPGHTLTLKNGRFQLGEAVGRPMHSRPIDDFFKSLAEEQRERAIAIILSGMGSNGAAGAQAIKAVGGLCIAQDPDSAAYPSMPRHLIDAGYADYILKPQDMPEMLLSYSGHPYARERGGESDGVLARDQQHVREILAVLRTRTRHDFSGYKKPTLLRRIQRRMGLTRVARLAEYAKLLRQTPAEVSALADDLLIHVTGYFRDPEAWEVLRERVIVPLVASREPGSTIRAWVAACSSGEEAYTLAMLIIEEAERVNKQLDIKIFATDTAERTLQNARQGVYPGGIESEVTPERLERFFHREDSVYRIRQDLRERVIFAPQNVLRDPPFSRLDIVTCRNLLIYLEPELQLRVLGLLHFGLREGGALFLGTSETVSGSDGLFETIDKKARIFRRIGPTRHGKVEFPLPTLVTTGDLRPPEARITTPRLSVAQLTTRALLESHTPAAVTVDRDLHILYYHGNTSTYLAQPAGEPTRDLMVILRDTVRGAVRTALHRAMSQGGVATENAWIDNDNGTRDHVCVRVSPIQPKPESDCFVVSFQAVGPWPVEQPNSMIESLESTENLRRMRDELQSTVEELQTSNEELKAAHEEVVSTNEELQSTNEELETSREEMQSLNEELSTVNSQLQSKMEEYQAVTSDLASLLTSTDIAVLFLDTRFRIRRFTPQVNDLLEVIQSDIGRPLSDLARKFEDPELLKDAAQVLERLLPSEREVRVQGDRWFLRRVTPYRTAENRIDGVVVTFVETTARRRAEEALRRSEEQFRGSIEEAPIPVILQAEDGEVIQVSSAWTELTGCTVREIPVIESWLQYVEGEAAGHLRTKLKALFAGASKVLNEDFTIRTRGGDRRHWSFTASCPGLLPDGRKMCVGMAVDITDRKNAEAELQSSKNAIEAASAMKDQFLANVSHELRTPLSVILMWSKLMSAGGLSEAEEREAVGAIVRSADAQRRLIEDLLDTTRIASGKLRVTLRPIELNAVITSAIEFIRPLALPKNLILDFEVEPHPVSVLGDTARLEQVVWILLHNAVKFSTRGGTIGLSLRREGERVVLSVSDTGRGVSPEFMPKLFQPFTQAPAHDANEKTGLGLGLSIARSLIQLHGGQIRAESRGEGLGTKFTIELPLLAAVAIRPGAEPAAGTTPTLERIRIMLVEDNGDALRAIHAALESAGATVHGFITASEALANFRTIAPGLIVSDVSMPEMDGLEFLRRIRALEGEQGLPRAKALALTALATKQDREAALSSGFDAFLAKPIDPDTLITTAHDLVNERKA